MTSSSRFVRPVHCAFCFIEMDPDGEPDPWDPPEVDARSRDDERAYVFNAHRACLLAAFHPEFRDEEDDAIIARYAKRS